MKRIANKKTIFNIIIEYKILNMDMEEKISFVQRQTNLEREEIRRLLELNDGDYIQVVRDQYIKKKDDQKEEPIQSVNQEIYKQLRFEMSQLQKMIDKTKKK
jgi:hypothetical protein